MTICMTNGGLYSDIKSINGRDVSEIKSEIITEILENDKFITIVFKDNSLDETFCGSPCLSYERLYLIYRLR